MTMTQENTATVAKINVGDHVRSFDFAATNNRNLTGPHSAYCEGQVIGYKWVEGCDRYEIAVSQIISGGKFVPLNNLIDETGMFCVYPPINGTPTLLGNICDGVVKIEPATLSTERVYIAYTGTQSEAQLAAELAGRKVGYGSSDEGWFVAFDNDDTDFVYFRDGSVPPADLLPEVKRG